ncbi:MAG: hypothetical protein WBN75_05970 [Verrucomicrobiia bacterium]|jgi:hypothetical protein
MNENENNFESLRRLLALKRHETPPPGYFNDFSSQVMQRIHVSQADPSANLAEELFSHAPWLSKLLHAFDARPMFAGGFAGALCLLLLLGIVYAERPDFTPQPLLQAENSSASLAAVTPTALPQPGDQMGIVSSTNPVFSLQPVASPFGQQNPLAQPVSFSLSGGN